MTELAKAEAELRQATENFIKVRCYANFQLVLLAAEKLMKAKVKV
jgi:hypothetical protein